MNERIKVILSLCIIFAIFLTGCNEAENKSSYIASNNKSDDYVITTRTLYEQNNNSHNPHRRPKMIKKYDTYSKLEKVINNTNLNVTVIPVIDKTTSTGYITNYYYNYIVLFYDETK